MFFLPPEVLKSHWPNIAVRERLHAVVGQSFIDKPATFIPPKPVFNQAVPINDGQAVTRHNEMTITTRIYVRVKEKVPVIHEAEEVQAQPKIEINDNVNAFKDPAAVHKERAWRQRRPTNKSVVIGMPPDHPSRRIIVARHPYPPRYGVGPPSVVKRKVAPRIIRLPAPAGVGIFPMSSIIIGTPADIHNGLPAKTVSRHIHPIAVGRELSLEIGQCRHLWHGRNFSDNRRGHGPDHRHWQRRR